MQIKQKKAGCVHTFSFGRDSVNVAYEDRSGSSDVDVPYEAIPNRTSIQIVRNEWIRMFAYIWLVLGILLASLAAPSTRTSTGAIFIFLGAFFLLWYRLRQIRFTVFQSIHDAIFVIDDKHHDRVIEELKAHRAQRLREIYGAIDPSDDLQKAIEKFRWLEDSGVLSPAEAAEKIAIVEAAAKNGRGPDRDVVN